MFDQTNEISDGFDQLSQAELCLPNRGFEPRKSALTAKGERRFSCMSAAAQVVHCSDGHISERKFQRPAIVAILEAVGGDMLVDCGGGEGRTVGLRSPHVSLVPAGVTVRLSARQARLFREVVIQVAQDPERENQQGRAPTLDFAPRAMIADKDVLRIAELISDDCLSGRPSDCVYGDSLAIILFKALSRLAEKGEKAKSQGGLAPWQLRRITEFLEANLVTGVRIDELASLVNLSSSYLIRAFKVSTGETPQKWLRAARVRRAQQLLVEGGKSLASVAQESGFADQAHLTRIFGVATGESPGAWRRARI